MGLNTILAISGRPGLFKLLTQTRGGFVAQSLLDNKKISVNAQSNVSILSEIAVYTLTEELPLKEVLKKIRDKENGGLTSVAHKASKDDLEEYFFSVLSDYDEDRVYASDIKIGTNECILTLIDLVRYKHFAFDHIINGTFKLLFY